MHKKSKISFRSKLLLFLQYYISFVEDASEWDQLASENLRLQVEKGNVSIGDQDLDCHGKDLILDKGVYEARIHFDRAGLKVW